jgi:hypothetical protein
MPRQARPDAPGTLHHAIIRGIECKEIVKDNHEAGTLIYAGTYAISYNRRHRRHGHLFQNRYKSIICSVESCKAGQL